MKKIDFSEFENYSIRISGEEMDNGELRFRLSSDYSSYIRTDSKKSEDLQRAHYHSEQNELFLIEKGKATVVMMEDDAVTIHHYFSGDVFSIAPMVPHNIRLMQGSILHTIKWGGKSDWIPYPLLDHPYV